MTGQQVPKQQQQPVASAMPSPNEESGAEDYQDSTLKEEQRYDGWRGWIVVTASALSLFVFMGVIYSWGILQAKLAGESSMSLTTLTFVGSLATSFMTSACIFVGKSMRKFGYRETAVAGAVLLGLGEFASSWVTHHLGALFITHGVIFGVGGGLTILVRALRLSVTNWNLLIRGTALLDRTAAVVQKAPWSCYWCSLWWRKPGRSGDGCGDSCHDR